MTMLSKIPEFENSIRDFFMPHQPNSLYPQTKFFDWMRGLARAHGGLKNTKHQGKLSAQNVMLRAVAPHPVMLRAVAASINELKKKRVAAYPALGAIFHGCSNQSNLLLVFSLLANDPMNIDPKLFGDNFDILTS